MSQGEETASAKFAVPTVSSRAAIRRLQLYLGNPIPDEEARIWAELSKEQRAKAMQRMTALTRWNRRKPPLDATKAAANAGLKLTPRFYEMAKDWADERSLKVIGVMATAPRTRKSRHEDLLTERTRELLDAEPKASVRQLALKLGETPGLGEKPPAYNTLRRFVDDEIRRRNRKPRPGQFIGFDCCPCSMQRMDGTEYTLFAIIDRDSQLIIGAALGNAADSRSGYAVAAAAALDRLRVAPLIGVAWLERVGGVQLVVGLDVDSWANVRSEAAGAGVIAPVEPSTRRQRFGRYLRAAAGARLGRIALNPTRTVEQQAGTGTGLSTPTTDDVTRLWIEIDAHNEPRLEDIEHDVGAEPPEDLLVLLRHLAAPPARGP